MLKKKIKRRCCQTKDMELPGHIQQGFFLWFKRTDGICEIVLYRLLSKYLLLSLIQSSPYTHHYHYHHIIIIIIIPSSLPTYSYFLSLITLLFLVFLCPLYHSFLSLSYAILSRLPSHCRIARSATFPSQSKVFLCLFILQDSHVTFDILQIRMPCCTAVAIVHPSACACSGNCYHAVIKIIARTVNS